MTTGASHTTTNFKGEEMKMKNKLAENLSSEEILESIYRRYDESDNRYQELRDLSERNETQDEIMYSALSVWSELNNLISELIERVDHPEHF